MKFAWILILALVVSTVSAQTYSVGTGNFPTSAAGLDMYPCNYFNNVCYDNLLAGYVADASGQGTQHLYTVVVGSGGTTSTFTNSFGYTGVTASQAIGWTITNVCTPAGGSGTAATCNTGRGGYTGTITANTGGGQYPGETYTVSPAASSAFAAGDLVTIQPPLTGLQPTLTGWAAGGVTLSQDTTSANLPAPAVSGLPQVTGLLQISVPSGGGTLSTNFDAGGVLNSIMNGVTTMNATFNLLSGSCSISALVERLGGQVFISSSYAAMVSGVHTYTWTGSGSETATTSPQSVAVYINFAGGPCVMDMTPPAYNQDAVSVTGAAGVDANGNLTPYAHTNGTRFSDTYVNIWKRGNYKGCRYNYVYGEAIAGTTLENLLQPIGYRMQATTSLYDFGNGYPGIPVGLEDFLEFSAAAGCTKVEYAVPPTFLPIDYTHMMAFFGASCTDSYGKIRCGLGHSASWLTSGMKINFDFNESWNTNFSGAYLGPCCSYLAQLAVGNVAASAIKASPYWNSNVTYTDDMIPSGGNIAVFNAGNVSADGVDANAYSSATTATGSQPTIYQAQVAEAEASATDTNLLQNQVGSQGGFYTTYEASLGSLSGGCTVTSCVGLYEGLGSGLVEATRAQILERAFSGQFQWFNTWVVTVPNQPYTSTASTNPATTLGIWDRLQNLRGAGAPPNGSYIATVLTNTAAAMGNGIRLTASSVPTFNFAAQNSIPNENNVPLIDVFAYCNGSGSGCTDTSRAYVLVNYDSTAHTVNLGTGLTLGGTVTKTVYSSTNGTPGLNDNNLTFNATPILQNISSTGAAASSYTLPAYSLTLLQGNLLVISGFVFPGY